MNIGELLSILSLIWLQVIRLKAEQRVLNEYIRHYEELEYDTEHLGQAHNRVKRGAHDPHIHLLFKAHGRSFNLRLRRDTSTFLPEAYIDNDLSHIYEGKLWGEPNSYVHGSIVDGKFAGRIHTQRGQTYYVERADQHFDNPKFSSIIYDEKDVNDDPHRYKRHAEHASCGASNPDVEQWMRDVQSSSIEPKVEKRSVEDNIIKANADAGETQHSHNVYASDQAHHREKRAKDDRKTCTLFLQSDTMLWDKMTKKKEKGFVGYGYPPDRAREEITSLFAQHVSGIKKIYEDTMFESKSQGGGLKYSGISFVVRRIKINETDRDCPDGEATVNNMFCKPNIDVSNFLNINSLSNHNDFCLAYVFSYRDFTGGTLGLAWVGSPSRASGGICEKFKEYQENKNRISKSLNTGIVTLINYNSPVPPKVSTLTFAHEVGHNFGSPHDSGSACTPFSGSPSDPKGNFIMYASATSGDRPNNSKFSPCSIGNVTLVLDAVFNQRFGKVNCFVEREAAFCGNNIVETDGEVPEQCDCGYEADCNDKCCYGRGHPKQCQLRENAQCSPSQGPCCTSECEKTPAGDPNSCSMSTDCNEASFCNGQDAQCPTPKAKNNMTACNKHTQVCISGECRGSICQRIPGWEQCFLEAPSGNGDKSFDKGKLCFVACRDTSVNSGPCISTGDTDELRKYPLLQKLLKDEKQESIKLPPGAPCNNFQGYCDVFQKCRDVDANGPLSRLKKLLFNEQTFNEIRDWIMAHWWAVLLMGMGLIVFMGIFIQVCAVHTPSSNPKKRPARKLTLTRPRQQGPPPPYAPGPSRGGPPHGKGRGPGGSRAAQYELRPHKVPV